MSVSSQQMAEDCVMSFRSSDVPADALIYSGEPVHSPMFAHRVTIIPHDSIRPEVVGAAQTASRRHGRGANDEMNTNRMNRADWGTATQSPPILQAQRMIPARDKPAIIITCLDGRVQEPALHWAQTYFQASMVNVITEYAPEMLLTQRDTMAEAILRRRVTQAMQLYGTSDTYDLAVVGHLTCEVGPQMTEERATLITQAVETIATWDILLTTIVGVLLDAEGRPKVIYRSDVRPRLSSVEQS